MKKINPWISRSTSLLAAVLSCAAAVAPAPARAAETFGTDLALLKQHTDVVVLSDETGTEQVAVVPQYQGRVMTSTADGADGLSYGWINPGLISSGTLGPHMNQFGGEDRLWLGPEGGQYGLFFKKGTSFDLPHWQTPAAVELGTLEGRAPQPLQCLVP